MKDLFLAYVICAIAAAFLITVVAMAIIDFGENHENHDITLTCEDGREGRTTPVMEPHYINNDMWHEDSYVVVRCVRG
jgi:hypothetical protein